MISTAVAVDICGAEKCYGNKSKPTLIFTNLNLRVPRRNIYGLLGPSGCGKTTLLRCILGRLKVDKGSVLVLGHSPGSKESGIPGPSVGYMSQETTVYLTMTIAEYFSYFGTILGISPKQIQTKTDYFIDLLRLPPKNTLAGKLSGGQLRRVQFAASLIHDPKLLILDEPTVGIDVITKQRMWEHLTTLIRNQDTSIVLTTHYIEEARLVDRVGMIHGSTLAVEDTTDNLLKNYNETSLEKVFLRICSRDVVEGAVKNNARSDVDDGIVHELSGPTTNCNEIPELNGFARKTQKWSAFKRCGFDISWHRLYPTMMRSFISLYRFPGVLLLLALLPSSQIILYTQAMGSRIGDIHIITINEDVGHLGAQYLSYLDPKVIVKRPYHDYDIGHQAFMQGESYGILHIRPNFSAVFNQRYSDFALANEELKKAGTIDLQVDSTNLNIAKYAEFHMIDTFQHFLYDTLSMASINPLVGQLPINISQETIQLLTRPPSMYVLSGLLTIASYFSSLPIAVFNIFMDRHKGYLEPNLIAGVTSGEIIIGTVLVQLVLLVIQNVAIVLAALPLLNSLSQGSVLLLFFLLYVQGIGGTALAIFISFLFDGPELIYSVITTAIFFSPASSGMFWPIESMPAFFRHFCQCLPLTMPGKAVEVIIHRGWDLRYSVIYTAFGISFLWIFIFLALSFLLCCHKK